MHEFATEQLAEAIYGHEILVKITQVMAID